MQRICQIVGWGLISLLLLSGGAQSYLIITHNPFWTEHPLRQHFIPLGHAHAGILGIIMLLYGLYLDKVNLSEQLKKWTAIIFIAGTLLMPGGFLLSVLSDTATEPGREILLVPIGGVLVGISFITMFIGMLRTKKTSL
jgi:uncharacterized membrane protein YgdD (TMEM256/DUF423 family)